MSVVFSPRIVDWDDLVETWERSRDTQLIDEKFAEQVQLLDPYCSSAIRYAVPFSSQELGEDESARTIGRVVHAFYSEGETGIRDIKDDLFYLDGIFESAYSPATVSSVLADWRRIDMNMFRELCEQNLDKDCGLEFEDYCLYIDQWVNAFETAEQAGKGVLIRIG